MTVFKLGTTIKNFIDGLNANFSELSNKGNVSYKILYDGAAEIPSKSSDETNTITLNDDITKYNGVIIQRETTGAWQRFENLSVGTILKVMNTESDFEYVEGCNLYMCNAEITATNQITLSNNVYSGVKTSAAGRYMESFGDMPLSKVIGIKFN